LNVGLSIRYSTVSDIYCPPIRPPAIPEEDATCLPGNTRT
jgi:hypothetical protein